MKTFFVKDLEVGKEITDFFMAKKAQIKTGSSSMKPVPKRKRVLWLASLSDVSILYRSINLCSVSVWSIYPTSRVI